MLIKINIYLAAHKRAYRKPYKRKKQIGYEFFFIFLVESNPVKNANWWTIWKRKSIKYHTTAERNKSTLLYLISLAILTAGASYAAVPLYRMFCQATSYGGTTRVGHDAEKIEGMEPQKERLITIKFTADTAATMQWNFRPQQSSIDVYAGETALAFYTVRIWNQKLFLPNFLNSTNFISLYKL